MAETAEDLFTEEELAELAKQEEALANEDLFDDVRINVRSVKAVKVKTFVTASQCHQATNINPVDITNSLIMVSAEYARFNVLAAKARLQRDSFASRLELLEAKLDKMLRDAAVEKSEKVTEPLIAQRIRRNAHYIEASQAVNESKAVLTVIEGTMRALEMKKDMLVQMNKNNNIDMGMSTSAVPNNIPAGKARYSEARRNLNSASTSP